MIYYLDPQDGVDNVIDIVSPMRFVEVGTNAIIDATAPKHGAYCLNTSANNGAFLRTPSDAGMRFGSGMFTIEVTARFASHSAVTQEIIISMGEGLSAANLGWCLSMTTAGQLNFMYSTSGTARINIGAAYTPAIGVDIDFAVDCDSGGVIRVYADGVVIASGTRSAAIFASTLPLVVGNHSDVSKKFPGAISGVRITKGVCRYAGAYTAGGVFATSAGGDPYFSSVTLLFVFNNKGDGTSFEDRCRTMQYGLTAHAVAIRPAAGDEIRLIAAPAPTSLGNVAWTNNSRTLTLPEAVTLTIDNCDTIWTAGTGGTVTLQTTNPKQGTGYFQVATGSSYAAGQKMAYRTLPATLDLSAYQQISTWFRWGANPLAGNLVELRFCSDATGDVPVHVVPLDQSGVASTWRILTKNFKAPLSSTINSISLWSSTLISNSTTFALDNIIACRASSDAKALTHASLIGKMTTSEPEWWPILSIDGTTVTLGGAANAAVADASNTPRPYIGATETVPTYRLQPLDPISGRFDSGGWPNALGSVGNEAAPILISGGWDRTSMTTQTGDTWLTGLHAKANALLLGGNSFNYVSKIGFAHFYGTPFTQTGSQTNSYAFRLQSPGAVGCGGYNITYWNQSLELDLGNINACTPYGFQVATGSLGDLTVRAGRISAIYGANTGSGMIVGATARYNYHFYVDRISNTDGFGVKVTLNGGKVTFYNTAIDNVRVVEINTSTTPGEAVFINPTVYNATPYTLGGDTWGDDIVRLHKVNGNAADHRSEAKHWKLFSDASVIHAATGYSWKLTPAGSGASVNAFSPIMQPLAKIEVKANVPTTILTWARRDSTSTSAGTMLRGGAIAGVPTNIKTTISAAANEWEQLALSFTPTEDGAVELLMWNATVSGNAWFHEISVA